MSCSRIIHVSTIFFSTTYSITSQLWNILYSYSLYFLSRCLAQTQKLFFCFFHFFLIHLFTSSSSSYLPFLLLSSTQSCPPSPPTHTQKSKLSLSLPFSTPYVPFSGGSRNFFQGIPSQALITQSNKKKYMYIDNNNNKKTRKYIEFTIVFYEFSYFKIVAW